MKRFQGKSYATVSMIPSAIKLINDEFDEDSPILRIENGNSEFVFEKNIHPTVAQIRKEIRNQLSIRLEEGKYNELVLRSCAMDPRFKDLLFINEKTKERIKNIMKK